MVYRNLYWHPRFKYKLRYITAFMMFQPDEDKLVTSVAIPAFDYKYNEEHNDALLLGVAGTDVPIDSIAKLAQPHQVIITFYLITFRSTIHSLAYNVHRWK